MRHSILYSCTSNGHYYYYNNYYLFYGHIVFTVFSVHLNVKICAPDLWELRIPNYATGREEMFKEGVEKL